MKYFESIMIGVLLGLIVACSYLISDGYSRLKLWETYATSQGCNFLGRANVDNKLMIQCADGFIRLEDTRTYGK